MQHFVFHLYVTFAHFDVMQQSDCYYLIKQKSGLTPAVGHVISAPVCSKRGVFPGPYFISA